jgi:ABC-type branched-subunit amino acid transport system permease subunit
MKALSHLLQGPQEIGRGPAFWVAFLVLVVALAVVPSFGTFGTVISFSYLLHTIPLALGLGLLWGYGGVLSFGQVAFYGVAGYTYGLIAGNLVGVAGSTLLASAAALVAVALLATAFGYFIFYGRVQMWIVPILTLVLTLVLETFMNQTAGLAWRIGNVRLGGYNGMTGIPSLQVGNTYFYGDAFYYLALVVAVVVYVLLRALVNSRFGHGLVASREDDLRTEVLGYDIRSLRLRTFIVSAILAGVSGLLYVQWGNFITPASMGIFAAVLPIIWVASGGRDSLLAVAIAAFLLSYLQSELAGAGTQYALVIMGGLLVVVMSFFPQGIIVAIARSPVFRRRKRSPAGESSIRSGEGLSR